MLDRLWKTVYKRHRVEQGREEYILTTGAYFVSGCIELEPEHRLRFLEGFD